MHETSANDVARAAQIAAAFSADDMDRVRAIADETMQQDGPVGLIGVIIALAAHLNAIASQFYDTDCQQILDMYAMQAMTSAEESE